MKRLLIISLFIFLSQSSYCQVGIVKGVITYININKVFKPDVGSTVVLITSDKIDAFKSDFKACEVNIENERALSFKARRIVDSLVKEHDKLSGFASSKKFKAIKEKIAIAEKEAEYTSKKLGDLNMKISDCETQLYIKYKGMSPDYDKTNIDGNGTYSFKLKPDKYIILISSANTTSKIFKELQIYDGKETNFSYGFISSHYGVKHIE